MHYATMVQWAGPLTPARIRGKVRPMFDAKALPPDIRAIIFDCDGTLVDTPPVYARAWAAGFRSSGKDMTPDWYLARAGMSEYVLMDAFEAEQGVTLRREEVVRLMRKAFLEGLTELREIARRHVWPECGRSTLWRF